MRKIFTLLCICLLASSISFASFPVKKETKNNQTQNLIKNSELVEFQKSAEFEKLELLKDAGKELTINKKESSKAKDEMLILLLLFFFLGGLAAHRWYVGKPIGWNILFILTFGGCGIWALIDLIKIIQGEFS